MSRKKNKDPKKSSMYYLARYSGLFFEMLGIIFLGTLLGRWIDGKVLWNTPVFTIVLALLSVFIALYLGLRDFLKPKN